MEDSDLHMISLFPVPDNYGSMYDFFYKCEQDEKLVTIPMIRDQLFSGKYESAYEYVNRYWSWFLTCVNNEKYPYLYKVHDIMVYPRTYFIDAHKPRRMQYFHHFVESMKACDAKRKARKGTRISRGFTFVEQDIQQPLPLQFDIQLDDLLEEPDAEELINDREIDEITDIPIVQEESEPVKESVEEPFKVVNEAVVPPRQRLNAVTWIVIGIASVVVVAVVLYLLLYKRE